MSGEARFDVEAVRRDFPFLEREYRGKPLAYLDSAASSQKPRIVIDTVADFYANSYANIHRGLYKLSAEATEQYEGARDVVKDFLQAADRSEIIFVRNATEAINLVARTWGDENVHAGDEILITALEHHANIVPWQMLCQRRSSDLRVAPINPRGEVDLEAFESMLGERTRLVALTHISNAIGTINPLAEMISMAKAKGITVLVDGAQAVPHLAVDVQALGCDFYAFSGHKLYAPSGIGVLYGRQAMLESMPPFMGGGDMIESVTFEKSTFAKSPSRFEAGTPDIAGAVGLSAGIRYLEGLDAESAAAWEESLLHHAEKSLASIDGLRIIGRAAQKAPIVSFVLDDIHAHDVGTALDQFGVAVRVGHHCAQPLMDIFGVPATVRASFALFNTPAEIDRLTEAVQETLEIFR
ncbi:MAG: cysteine desulfurase [Myxococcota bacterium]|nr:cysteine desulfurase [Myxococcota bacterium]